MWHAFPVHVRVGVRVGAGAGLLAAAAIAVGVGAWPAGEVLALGERVWPVLLFAVAMTVVSVLASEAGVFDAAARLARCLAGPRAIALWGVVIALTIACTVFLSLDTTAVLLTPVAVALARRIALDPRPFALTVVWLANTASLLLPISNLTNLLAFERMGVAGPLGFAAIMWPAWLACTLVPIVFVAVRFRRQLVGRGSAAATGDGAASRGATTGTNGHESDGPASGAPHQVAARNRPHDRALLRRVSIVLVVLLAALLTGVPVWIPATAAALVLLFVVGRARSGVLRLSLVPWRMLVLTLGLFAATGALGSIVVHGALAHLPALGDTFGGLLATAGLGAGTANLANNLPAYLLLEPIASSPALLAALLVGVGAGPLITPWASLATLLWQERLVADGVRVRWGEFVWCGAIIAPACLLLGCLGVLLVT